MRLGPNVQLDEARRRCGNRFSFPTPSRHECWGNYVHGPGKVAGRDKSLMSSYFGAHRRDTGERPIPRAPRSRRPVPVARIGAPQLPRPALSRSNACRYRKRSDRALRARMGPASHQGAARVGIVRRRIRHASLMAAHFDRRISQSSVPTRRGNAHARELHRVSNPSCAQRPHLRRRGNTHRLSSQWRADHLKRERGAAPNREIRALEQTRPG